MDRQFVQGIAFQQDAERIAAIIDIRVAVQVRHVRAFLRDDGSAPGIVIHGNGRAARNDQGAPAVDPDIFRRSARLEFKAPPGMNLRTGGRSVGVNDGAVSGLDAETVDSVRPENKTGFRAAAIDVRIAFEHGDAGALIRDDGAGPRGIGDKRRAAFQHMQYGAFIDKGAAHEAAGIDDRGVSGHNVERVE